MKKKVLKHLTTYLLRGHPFVFTVAMFSMFMLLRNEVIFLDLLREEVSSVKRTFLAQHPSSRDCKISLEKNFNLKTLNKTVEIYEEGNSLWDFFT